MQILILTRQLFHWKDVIIQLWQLSKISRYHVREPCLSCIIQNSVCPRFKFGNLCFAFSTKANIRGAKMAYNRPAGNRNVLQIYLTSDVLSLYSSQPACENIHPNQYGERLGKTTYNVAVWRRMPFANTPILKLQWLPNRRVSARAVRNRLKSAGLKSKAVVKRTICSDRHQWLRLPWCLARRFVLIWGPCGWSICRTRAGFCSM
jgi:hypothetical protein